MSNPPYPYRDRKLDHLSPWVADDGIAYFDGKPAFTETWCNGKRKLELIYPVSRKVLAAFAEAVKEGP